MDINLIDYGAKGDGINDDSDAIEKALKSISDSGGGTLIFPKGEYKVTKEILIQSSNIILCGEVGNLIKYYGKGLGVNLINIKGTYKNPIHDVVIDGLNLDGTNQEYKGGASDDDLKLTSPNPKYGGMTAIYCLYGYRIKILNNSLNDFYGNGIILKRCAFSRVYENYLTDCSASGMASVNTDYQGDGITAFMSFSIKVSNNTIVNRRVFKVHYILQKDVYGLQCGRSGLEFEYGVDKDVEKNPEQWCPFYSELVSNTTAGYDLIFENNYVYGYNKGCHLEYNVNARVDGNAFIHCNIGILDATGGNTQIINNEFNSDNVGASPQGGYHLYYTGVAITHFLGSENLNNPIIQGNIFYGNSVGVTVGRSNVDIRNNMFRLKNTSIYKVADWYHNININGNQFVCMYENEEESKDKYFIDLSGNNHSIINNSFYVPDGIVMKNRLVGLNHLVSNNNCRNTLLSSGQGINICNSYNFIYKKNSDGSISSKMFEMNAGYQFSNNIVEARHCYIKININSGSANNNRFFYGTVKIKSDLWGVTSRFNISNNIITFWESCEFDKGVTSLTTDSRVDKTKYKESIFSNNIYENYPNKYITFFNYYGGKLEELELKNNIPNTYKNIVKGTINPVNGKYYAVGDKVDEIYNGNYYRCCKSGYFSDIKWESNKTYTSGIFVVNSVGDIYRCRKEINSNIEPILKDESFTTEDGILWEYFGEVCKFEEYDIDNKLISK